MNSTIGATIIIQMQIVLTTPRTADKDFSPMEILSAVKIAFKRITAKIILTDFNGPGSFFFAVSKYFQLQTLDLYP